MRKHLNIFKLKWNSQVIYCAKNYDLILFIIGRDMKTIITQIAKFVGPTWGPPGSCQPQMGPMLAPWTLLSGYLHASQMAPSKSTDLQKKHSYNTHRGLCTSLRICCVLLWLIAGRFYWYFHGYLTGNEAIIWWLSQCHWVNPEWITRNHKQLIMKPQKCTETLCAFYGT